MCGCEGVCGGCVDVRVCVEGVCGGWRGVWNRCKESVVVVRLVYHSSEPCLMSHTPAISGSHVHALHSEVVTLEDIPSDKECREYHTIGTSLGSLYRTCTQWDTWLRAHLRTYIQLR